MNTRLQKQDEDDEHKKYEEDMEMERQQGVLAKEQLIKDITAGVIQSLTKENMELNADKFESVSHSDIFEKDGGDEDKQVDVALRNETNEVQKPIQAMMKELVTMSASIADLKKHFLKEHADLYEHDETKEEVMGDDEMGMDEPDVPMPDMGMDEEAEDEYPMDENEEYKMVKSLKKEINALKKSFDGAVENKAKQLAESTLKRNGWNKETSKQPRLIKNTTMGLDENPIIKSQNTEEIVDQLSSMSWGELANLRHKKLTGNTDGIPQELL